VLKQGTVDAFFNKAIARRRIEILLTLLDIRAFLRASFLVEQTAFICHLFIAPERFSAGIRRLASLAAQLVPPAGEVDFSILSSGEISTARLQNVAGASLSAGKSRCCHCRFCKQQLAKNRQILNESVDNYSIVSIIFLSYCCRY
jgi:hypothetical protein